jgi:hypothetical protein
METSLALYQGFLGAEIYSDGSIAGFAVRIDDIEISEPPTGLERFGPFSGR